MADFQEMGKIDFLKPCPFCGGEAQIECIPAFRHPQTLMIGHEWWAVHCSSMSCGITTPAGQNKEWAIEAWNRRADDE